MTAQTSAQNAASPIPHTAVSSVAFLGPDGSFSSFAARSFSQNVVAKKTLHMVFESVINGECDFGIAASESNVEGYIGATLDLLKEFSDVIIVDAVWVNVLIDAVQIKGDSNQKVIKAHSHALAQCSKFIELNNLSSVASLSNSHAAKTLQKGEIALIPNVEKYGSELIDENNLEIQSKMVQDFSDGATQFILFRKKTAQDEGIWGQNDAKNVYSISPKTDSPGTLLNIIEPIYHNNINITSLFSRPNKGEKNEYVFYLTLSSPIPEILRTDETRFLGSFKDKHV